jgi:hypothetical protein
MNGALLEEAVVEAAGGVVAGGETRPRLPGDDLSVPCYEGFTRRAHCFQESERCLI